MAELTFYGGIDEIGGNKILLEEQKTRVFLDMGLSFGLQKRYYDEYLQARNFALIDEFISFGMLPSISGLYREDFLKHVDAGHPLREGSDGKAADAVVISHAHLDHVGLIPYLRPDIQLIGSETTHQVLSYLDKTTSGDGGEYCTFFPSFRLVPMKKGEGVKKADRRDLADESIQREYTTISKGRTQQVGDIELDEYPVDHSLAGASGYIIHTSKGNIAYTGDLRFHGYNSKATEEYVKALEETDIKILLCEGTRAEGSPDPNERALSEEMKKAIEKTRELVLIYYPQRDSARMRTIVEAAKACDRKFLINPKQAFFLDQIKGCSDAILPDTNNIEILLPRKAWGVWGNPAYDDKIQKQDYTNAYPTPVRDFIFEQSNLVTPQEVAQSQKEYVVSCSFYELNLLHDLSPKEGSCFIWSRSGPFDEEGSIELAKVENWLSHFKLGEPIPMHCSGHLSGPET